MNKIISNNFPESRYRHCYDVGMKMYYYAKKVLNWPIKRCEEIFVLGNLHDIGYELDANAFGHEEKLYEIVKDTYSYSNEIRYHSKLQDKYLSAEMKLLYFADATVDGNGNWVTYKERLKDIEDRYGLESEVYKETANIIKALQEWNFDDSL